MIEFEDLRDHAKGWQQKEQSFVLYHLPGESKIHGLYADTKTVRDQIDFESSGFAFAPFLPRRKSYFLPFDQSRYFEADLPDGPPSSSEWKVTEADTQKQEHIHLVKQALPLLKAGSLDKVVLSRKLSLPRDSRDPLVIFERLVNTYPEALVYCWFHPETNFWMAATPEILVQTKNLRFQTMALAGTQKIDPAEQTISWGKKELQEQQFVIDEILDRLKAAGLEDIRAADRETIQAGQLLHLKTTITGQLKQAQQLKELVHLLHPTAAVCGLPRDRALEFILKQEPYDRSYYTGFIGPVQMMQSRDRSSSRRNTEQLAYRAVHRQTSLFVNLRCLQMTSDQIHLYVGGGITSSSDPEAEWQETINKSQTLLSVL
ncbi:chorismate-binding protein [Croceiramulus getboli]|nr:chorismate-binding protein [Flavobacteriaceae bacterium YJPT1-3]